jgi:hypothetical protein
MAGLTRMFVLPVPSSFRFCGTCGRPAGCHTRSLGGPREGGPGTTFRAGQRNYPPSSCRGWGVLLWGVGCALAGEVVLQGEACFVLPGGKCSCSWVWGLSHLLLVSLLFPLLPGPSGQHPRPKT